MPARLSVKVQSIRLWISRAVPAALEQILFFGGLAAVSFGLWMIYHPLGPIAGGAFGVWISFLIAAERGTKR